MYSTIINNPLIPRLPINPDNPFLFDINGGSKIPLRWKMRRLNEIYHEKALEIQSIMLRSATDSIKIGQDFIASAIASGAKSLEDSFKGISV